MKCKNSIFLIKISLFLTFCFGPISSAHAVLELVEVNGTWTNLTGDAPSTFQGIGTNEVRWGTPLGSQKSGFRFDGSAPPASPIMIGDPFLLGTFTHFNFRTASGTAVQSADLAFSLGLNDGQSHFFSPFDFSFGIEETPNFFNVGSCPPFQQSSVGCDDRISFPSNFPTQSFTLDNQDLTLELLGFQIANNTVPAFVTQEQTTNSAMLLARITTPPVGVIPEPTTILLVGLGGGVLFLRKKYQ